MKSRLGIVELGLTALVGVCGWAVWTDARQAATRQRIFGTEITLQGSDRVLAEPLAKAVRPSAYSTISERNLFTTERGTRPPSTPQSARQAPAGPLPVLSGIADLGNGPAALLATQPGEKASWVAAGQRVGSYRLEAIQGELLTFSFRGQTVSVTAKELQDEDRRRAASPRAASSRPAAQISNLRSGPSNSRPRRGRYRIGAEFRPGRFAADATDGAGDGTVYEGYVRRVRQSPFGAQHWWEKQE